jgi:hypothetical protein
MIAMSSGFAVALGEAHGSVEHPHRERLQAALAVGDAELEARAGLHDRSRGEGRGVQEDVLAVIGGDEAETLLVVVEPDLAGGHAKPRSALAAVRAP